MTPTLPANEYVEIRDERYYYIPGTRIHLDILVHAFGRGDTAEQILQSYPSIGSLARVYGAIAFILDHPDAIEAYMKDIEELWRKIRLEYPNALGEYKEHRASEGNSTSS